LESEIIVSERMTMASPKRLPITTVIQFLGGNSAHFWGLIWGPAIKLR
jgi:hypothetical protein